METAKTTTRQLVRSQPFIVHTMLSRNLTIRTVQIIQTEVVNLYSILQSMDIMSIKETLIDGLKIGELVRYVRRHVVPALFLH